MLGHAFAAHDTTKDVDSGARPAMTMQVALAENWYQFRFSRDFNVSCAAKNAWRPAGVPQ